MAFTNENGYSVAASGSADLSEGRVVPGSNLTFMLQTTEFQKQEYLASRHGNGTLAIMFSRQKWATESNSAANMVGYQCDMGRTVRGNIDGSRLIPLYLLN